jgi:hypothetical protein
MGIFTTRGRVAALLAVSVAIIGVTGAARAASIDTIYEFQAASVDIGPVTGLVPGPSGALYGATSAMVYQLTLKNGKGVVIPIFETPDGPATAIASFGRAVYVAFGLAYGKSCPQSSNCGAILALTAPLTGTKWAMSTVYDFKGGKDGFHPSGIAVDPKGTIYGTTKFGGSTACDTTGCGTLFRIERVGGVWKEAVLHIFKGGLDGANPGVAPTIDNAGNLYGTASEGFNAPGNGGFLGPGNGFLDDTPSKIDGSVAALMSLDITAKGKPVLVRDFESELLPYTGSGKTVKSVVGASIGGGNVNDCSNLGAEGCGTVFQLTKPTNGKTPWTFALVHAFSGTDGQTPSGTLLRVGNAIYGIADGGPSNFTGCPSFIAGAEACGVIYKLTNGATGWVWGNSVTPFGGGVHGFTPVGGLTYYKSMIMGVTRFGGSSKCNCGTLFIFKP